MSVSNLTVNQLILDALNLIDLYTEDRTPPARFINDGIRYLNTITSVFEKDNILIPYNETLKFAATVNKGSYYISKDVGADVDFAKPCYISMVQLVYLNALYPVKRMYDADWFERFSVQNTSGQPLWWNYQRHENGSTLYLYPTPSMAYEVRVKGKFSQTNWIITDDLSQLDPAYYEFLILALANRYSDVYKTAIWTDKMQARYDKLESLFRATSDADWSMKTVIQQDTGFAGWLVNPR